MNARIRELRKNLGLSQTEFGERLGLKQTTIAGYETRGRTPIDAVVSLICREFSVNETWLRTGDGDMFTTPSNSSLDALAKEYHLSAGACALIRRFLELDEDIQQAFVDYAVQVANDLTCGQEADNATKQGEDQ